MMIDNFLSFVSNREPGFQAQNLDHKAGYFEAAVYCLERNVDSWCEERAQILLELAQVYGAQGLDLKRRGALEQAATLSMVGFERESSKRAAALGARACYELDRYEDALLLTWYVQSFGSEIDMNLVADLPKAIHTY